MHQGTGLLAGKYRLVERLGQGGMGAVWRAEHVQLRTTVAVKLMSPKTLESKTFRARFEREARAAAQLKTRHVVTVHDYGVEQDVPYIVMELLEGEDLATKLRRERRVQPAQAAVIVAQIARALERAHAVGLVHRDLKPANVFLTRQDDEAVVKVLDFGIAKEVSAPGADGLTDDDEVLGTPTYMSPEQIRSMGAVDLRTDLWALGVIAYRLLTGALPFAGGSGGDLVVRVCTEPATPPSQHDPALGPEVDAFFRCALAKDPAGRFSSAREMSAAFEAILGVAPAARRASLVDIPVAVAPPPSSAATPLEPETSLSHQHTRRGLAQRPAEDARHRRIAAIGALGLTLGLLAAAALALALRRADPPRAAASADGSASARPAPDPLPSVSPIEVTVTPSASAPPSAEPAAPAASATDAPSAVPPRLRPWPSKRRKVEIGL